MNNIYVFELIYVECLSDIYFLERKTSSDDTH